MHTDETVIELLICLKDGNLYELVNLCNLIYDSEIWPKDFTNCVVPVQEKKTMHNKVHILWVISLITHTAKILLKVLNRCVMTKMEENIRGKQLGFRGGMLEMLLD